MNKKGIMGIISSIVIIALSLVVIGGIIEAITAKVISTEQVPCRDRQNSIINNVTCTQEILGCGIITKWFDDDCR